MNREMKDSGVEWIGEIPRDWKVLPLGRCFKERKEQVSDLDYEPLSVTKQGIVKQLENAAKSNNHDARKKVCIGDFVINSRSDRKQSCGLSDYEGSVSLINIVLENKTLKSNYIKYSLKNYGFAEEFYRWGTGIVADLWSTRYDKMKRISISIPPKNIQNKIAIFLDDRISEIDNIIANTTLSIEEYKKYKQSIITEAVTKGLNSDVEMKYSGVEYISQIPLSWTVMQMKYVTTLAPKCNTQKFTNGSIVTFTPMECVKNGSFENRECTYDNYNSSYDSFENEDIIIAKVTPCFENRNIAIVKNLYNGYGFGSSELFVLRCTNITNDFMFYYLQNKDFMNRAASTMTGTGGLKRVSSDFMKNNKIAIPPINEQNEIVNFLYKKSFEIESLISQKQQLLTNLELYKISLIYECVTGKREV